MGKSSKLRRIFGLNRRKASPTLDKKLSLPKLLQKSPAPPNQYFREGKEQEDEMTQQKLDHSMVEEHKSPKRKHLGKPANEDDHGLRKSPLAEADIDLASRNTSSMDVASDLSQTYDDDMSTTTDGLGLASGACGLREHARDPRFGNISSSDNNRDTLFSPSSKKTENPRMYRKEFPVHRNKLVRQTNSETSARVKTGSDEEMEDISDTDPGMKPSACSSEWNASGACRMTASSLVPAEPCSSFNPTDCSCGQCNPPGGPVKDCDWGWLTNVSTPLARSDGSQQPGSSGVVSCSFKVSSFPISKHMQQPYVNDEQRHPVFHFGVGSSSFAMTASRPTLSTEYHQPEMASEITFTVTEANGRILQLSVINPERRNPAPSRNPFTQGGQSSMTSTHFQVHNLSLTSHDQMKIPCDDQPLTKFGKEDSFDINSRTFESGQPNSSDSPSLPRSTCVKMTPSLSSRNRNPKANQEMAAAKDRVRSNGEILQNGAHCEASPHQRGHKVKPKGSPHFELSMASYSKLIAYCDTNKLVIQSSARGRNAPPGQGVTQRDNQQNSSLNPTGVSNGALWSRSQPAPAPAALSCSANNAGQVNDLCRLARVLETVEECSWYWGSMTGQDSRKVLRDSAPGTFLLRDSSDPRYLFSLSVKTRQGPTSIRIVYTDGAFRFDSEMDDVSSRRQGNRESQTNRDGSRRNAGHPNYVKRLTPVFTCVINMILFYTNHLGLEKPRVKKPVRESEERKEEAKGECERRFSSSAPTSLANSPESTTPVQGSGSAPPSSNSSERPEQFMCYWVNRGGRQEIPVMLSTPKTQGFPSLQRLCRQTLSSSQKLWVYKDKIEQFPLPNSLKKYIKKYPYPI